MKHIYKHFLFIKSYLNEQRLNSLIIHIFQKKKNKIHNSITLIINKNIHHHSIGSFSNVAKIHITWSNFENLPVHFLDSIFRFHFYRCHLRIKRKKKIKGEQLSVIKVLFAVFNKKKRQF